MSAQTASIYMSLEQVCDSTTLGPTTWWALVNTGEAPKPRKLSKGRTGWLRREVEDWAESRPVSDIPPPVNAGRRRKAEPEHATA